MKKISKENFKKNNIVYIIPTLVLVIVASLTVGFSAFTTSLMVNDIALTVRVQKDIRVTNTGIVGASSEGSSFWEDYNVNSIKSSVNLPNSNSTITYQVEITNFGNVEMGIADITGLPSNLTYTVDSNTYTMKDPICDDDDSTKCKLGAIKKINITIGYDTNGYNSNNTEYQFELNFDFKRLFTISYDGFSTTAGLPTTILEDESKSITFTSANGIPNSVLVTGATESYTSPTLTLSNTLDNITVYKKHTITYVLNGGTQASGQITEIASVETYTLLNPTKDDGTFSGWYEEEDFSGTHISTLTNVQSDITLYAKWTTYDYAIDEGEFDGTANSVINTGIKLYSAENVNRNFRIAFTIDSYNSDYDTASNVSASAPPTILSSMVETGSPYSGFVFRVAPNKDVTYNNIKINDSHVKSFNGYYDLSSGLDVEIVRENGALYTKINSNIYNKVLEYESDIDTFDVPLTIGGNINSQGNFDRFFDGQLSNITVEFYEGSIVNNYSYTEIKTDHSYQLNGTIIFDGTNYIDTGLNLFSPANINKDFDISLTIDEIGTNASQATLINAKDESQNNSWPGFAYRLNSGIKFDLTARWPGQSNGSGIDNNPLPRTVTITRRSGVVYYSYSGSATTKLIATPASSLNNEFKPNLTFGSSLDASGEPFRYFVGIVTNINVQLYDS